ncbi:MAG: hypothetical protein GXO87_12680 [Chlorobi bacterium]|nr:hypothetical protein [Chlorobiota bacterium]
MLKRFIFKLETIIAIFLSFGISNVYAQTNTNGSAPSESDSITVSISAKFNSRSKHNKIYLSSNKKDFVIRYTLNGSNPTGESPRFGKPIQIFGSGMVKAAAFKNGKQYGAIDSLLLINHKAIGVKPEYDSKYSEKYDGGGKYGLTDGIRGSKNFKDGLWQGVEGANFEFVLDLNISKLISKISLGTLQNADSSIFFPRKITLFGSQDGMEYHKIDEIINHIPLNTTEAKLHDFIFQKRFKARFVKIIAENIGVCPEWSADAGKKTWIFADEVIVK